MDVGGGIFWVVGVGELFLWVGRSGWRFILGGSGCVDIFMGE